MQKTMTLLYICCLVYQNLTILPDNFTRHVLNLLDETKFDHSVIVLMDPNLGTIEFVKTKQVVETVWTLGKNACL